MTDAVGESGPDLIARGNDTFVVRIWSSDGTGALRGYIQHVRSRKRTYFATRQRLLTFIQDQLQKCQS
jgi:hypothetical protein